jgi:hypothetical protein
VEKTHKLWQSMINTDLSPGEFLELRALGQIRRQSLRQLVSTILRQELRAYSGLIKEHEFNVLPTSLDSASPKRQRGRPRIKETNDVIDPKKQPASMLDIIDDTGAV